MGKVKPIHLDFDKLYGVPAEDFDLNSQEFRFTAIRPGVGNLNLDEILETVEWRDEGTARNLNTIPVLRGTATWRRPDSGGLLFGEGHRVRCEVKWLGRWKPLWEMRVLKAPEVRVEDDTMSAELGDDLILASKSSGRFRYVENKKHHPHGWLYHEIVLDICKRYRIPVGFMVTGKRRFPHFDPGLVSPLEAIRQAVEKEQEYTGRRFVIAWRPDGDGRFGLHITHPHRNSTIYTFGRMITSGTSSPIRRAQSATAILAIGTTKAGKHGKRRKFVHREVAASAVKRYGYIERRWHVPGNVKSRDEVIAKAKHELAKELKPVLTLTGLEHPGIAFMRRGDTVRINLPKEGFKGAAGIQFVVSVTHSLSGGQYTMSMDVTWRDPLNPNAIRSEREAALRARKRAANN